jgi:hypothetical protein
MESKFLKAVEWDEVERFLLGKGEYFSPGSEFTGGRDVHDKGFSFFEIVLQIKNKRIGELEAYSILENAIVHILQKDFSAKVVFNMSMYVWMYFTDIESGTLREEWKFSDELLKLLRDGYRLYLDDKSAAADAETLRLMEENRSLIKERFDFEL